MKVSSLWRNKSAFRASSKDDKNIQFGMVIMPTNPFGLANEAFLWMKQAYKSALESL